MLKKIKDNIIFIFGIVVFSVIVIGGDIVLNEKKLEKIQYTKDNLVTLKEKILLNGLEQISGYHLTNNGSYVNPFSEDAYIKIYKMRNEKPENEEYVFCNTNEFIEITDVFEKNVNKNNLVIQSGGDLFKFYRKNCKKD